MQQQKCKVDFDQAPELKYYHPDPALDPAAVGKIKAMIAASKRPCIYAGGGIISAGASEELVKFAESYNIPVVTTLMGIGAIPDSHPLSLRWLGMHGTVYANYAANECDLLLAFGARFDDRVTGNPKSFAVGAKIVHVDIDDSEINKNKPADLGVLADIREVLTKLNEAPEPQEYAEWFARIREWKKKYPFHYRNKPDHVQPQFVMETLSRLTRGQAVIVPGVGQHQMWAAQYYDYNYPRQLLTSGGLGAMGFGLPPRWAQRSPAPKRP